MPSPILYDLQGAQSTDHRDRGIARYVVELAIAIEDAAPGRVSAFVLNPDLALPSGIEPLVESGRLRFVDEVATENQPLLHLPSTIELAIPLDRLFPPKVRRSNLVVTLFDLVQEALPEEYLEDPGVRRRYRSRLEVVRQADAVIAISDHTRREATRLLGIPPDRITSVPLVASPAFRPPASRAAAASAARAVLPGLRDDYVLYTAGSDGRKNLERLLEAWARMPTVLRSRHQLVVACHLPPLRRNHLEVMANGLGIGDGVLFTGFVDENTLVRLNQGARLAVMPSLDEGFGLPVAEALATGSPVIGSDRTSIPELLPPQALFDPMDASAIAAAIERALDDPDHRAGLIDWAGRPRRTWRDVAAETLAVYDGVAPRSRRRPTPGAGRTRLRMAFTTPLPPQPGGIATYSKRLLDELGRIDDITVDVYIDGPPHSHDEVLAAEAPAGLRTRPLAALARVEAFEGRYDEVVYCLGNSEFHTGSLAALLARPGIVLAHEVRLTTLYRFAAWQHPEAVPGGFHATLQRMYRGMVPANLGAEGGLDAVEADRWGVFMAKDAIARSRRFLVTSAFAAQLARLDAPAEQREGRIDVVPFAVGHSTGDAAARGPAPGAERPGPAVIASFGVLNAIKGSSLVVDAFAMAMASDKAPRDTRLVFVGRASAEDVEAIRLRAVELGVAQNVKVTGEVDPATYVAWLERAWIAIQLRSSTNGESSAAVGDCLSAGLPTIVSAIGAQRALPANAVVHVAAGAAPEAIAAHLAALLASPERRNALGANARVYAEAHSFGRAATALYEAVCSVSGWRASAGGTGESGDTRAMPV